MTRTFKEYLAEAGKPIRIPGVSPSYLKKGTAEAKPFRISDKEKDEWWDGRAYIGQISRKTVWAVLISYGGAEVEIKTFDDEAKARVYFDRFTGTIEWDMLWDIMKGRK